MTGPWTHSICDKCWRKQEPGHEPHRAYRQPAVCCYCGEHHRSGIYYRDDPARLLCAGDHLHLPDLTPLASAR